MNNLNPTEADYIIDTARELVIPVSELIPGKNFSWTGPAKEEYNPWNGNWDAMKISYLWFLKRKV